MPIIPRGDTFRLASGTEARFAAETAARLVRFIPCAFHSRSNAGRLAINCFGLGTHAGLVGPESFHLTSGAETSLPVP